MEAMLWIGLRGLNVSSKNVTPTPSVPPTSRKAAGVQGFPLTISANKARRTEMTLPSSARSGDRLIEKGVLVPG